ncbi:transcriptional repressor [Candidatus Nomurabacteria bacterium]|nr:transcriptional repressor [Candidatus Nomurabacteria bacterium]MCB9819258.1 transcriptional repressor [Candidatus Nomurabacteria bacterium]
MNRRHSPKREKVLNVLKDAHCALSAADIHRKIPEIDLTTIYRNLELFVSDGLIKKLDLDKDEAMYEYKEGNHHHAICTDCNKVIHFNVSDLEIMKLIKVPNFTPESLELTVRGKCKH